MQEEAQTRAAPIKPSTEKGYLKSVNAAHRYSIKVRTTDVEEPALVKMTQVVQDLVARQDLTRQTKLTARAALMWFIQSGRVARDADTVEAEQALKDMAIPTGAKHKKSRRPKTIPEQDLAAILDLLYTQAEAKGSIWSYRTTVWIHAGLATGARPIEWLNASWADEEQTTLKLQTAKIKLLAPAFHRTAEIDEDDPVLTSLGYWDTESEPAHRLIELQKESDRSLVNTQIEYIREAAPLAASPQTRAALFEKYYKACAQVLDRACRRLWKDKLYSLYTMRSQFAANMHALNGPEKTAILMGHSNHTSPSVAHYGKWNQAHARFKGQRAVTTSESQTPIPTPEQSGPIE